MARVAAVSPALWLALGGNVLLVLLAVALSVSDRETFSTPERLAAVAHDVSEKTRASWDRDRCTLGDLVSARGGRTRGQPVVGRLVWWATDGISDGVDTVRLAVDVPGQPGPVVLTESLGTVTELQPGMLVPVVDPGDGAGLRLALGLPADRVGELLAGYRRERGLLDDHQHDAWLRGQRLLADVVDVRPTGRVRDDAVEVTAELRVTGEPVTATGFVRPEEASAMRRSGQVPVSILDGRPVLGWFPF